jgi:flagellar hook-associated protein 3 FlgL
MSWPPTLGSQALSAQLHRTGLSLRADVQRHSLELVSGRVKDPAAHLRGDLGPLTAIETRLTRIAAQDSVLRSASHLSGSAQANLGTVVDTSATIRDRLLTVASSDASSDALTRVGQSARAGLSTMISALSAQTAGRSIFAGTATDRGPLPDAAVLMDAVVSHLAGAVTAADIAMGIATFFDTPGGPFETSIYLGAPPAPGLNFPPEVSVPALPTAADPAIRGALRGAVMGALLADAAIVPEIAHRRELAVLAMQQYPDDIESLIGLRASVGDGEAALHAGRNRLSSERDALLLARDGLIGVDPYAAASRLEETRARLEALYAITARVARLSLTEYVR